MNLIYLREFNEQTPYYDLVAESNRLTASKDETFKRIIDEFERLTYAECHALKNAYSAQVATLEYINRLISHQETKSREDIKNDPENYGRQLSI